MGRSVSRPSNAFAVAYIDVLDFGYQHTDDEGNEIENPEYDELQGQCDWEFFIDDLKYRAKKLFPSMQECDEWLDNEDHVILENRFAYFGVSEYCGLASVWMVLKDNLSEYNDVTGIAENWAKQVESKFEKEFAELRRIGTFSNGESVYEQVNKDDKV